jgi:hypothetical protein
MGVLEHTLFLALWKSKNKHCEKQSSPCSVLHNFSSVIVGVFPSFTSRETEEDIQMWQKNPCRYEEEIIAQNLSTSSVSIAKTHFCKRLS